MPTTTATPQRKWQTIQAVVTRADGTVENRGLISFYHSNPIINQIGGVYVKLNYAVGEWRRARMAKRKRS